MWNTQDISLYNLRMCIYWWVTTETILEFWCVQKTQNWWTWLFCKKLGGYQAGHSTILRFQILFLWYCRLATVTIFDGDRDLPLLPVYPLPVYQRSLCDPFITHESDVSREGRTFFPSLVYPLLTRLTYPVSSTDAYGGYDRLRISLSLSTLDFSLTLSIFGKLINRYPRNWSLFLCLSSYLPFS